VKLEAVFPRLAACAGLPASPSDIPMDDAGAFRLLSLADTAGIDRFDHDDSLEYLRRLAPDRLAHLVAFQALNRMSTIKAGLMDRYIERRHGRQAAICEIPSMSSCFSESCGLPLYREQVERAAVEAAGMRTDDAARFAAAFCRFDEESMPAMSERFVEGAGRRGIDALVAGEMIAFFRRTASFTLPRKRLAEFALEGYRLAWLKSRFKEEFEALRLEAEGAPRLVPA
jgi:DNA polymerase-3 subunit alpha